MWKSCSAPRTLSTMSKALKKAEIKLIKAKTALTYVLFVAAGIGAISGSVGLFKLLLDLFGGSGSL